MALKKADLIQILVEEYGYEKDDIKLFTNGKLQALIKQEEDDAKELEESETRVVAKASKLKDDDMILVMNGTIGGLTHRSQATGRIYEMQEFGQTTKMPFSELLNIRNLSPNAFKQGYFIILDKLVQEEFGLLEMYKNIVTPDNFDNVFRKSVSELEEFIDNLPEGMKVAFAAKAREMYATNQLDSVAKVKFIQQKFNFSFEDNAPLNDIL